MRRRTFLATAATAGVAGTAGCGMARADTTLSDPTVHAESDARRSLSFTADGEEIANFGADATVRSETVAVDTELWHREGTTVRSIRLQVWTNPADAATEIAVASPVEGDSSPPPVVTLSSPERGRGTVVEVTDLDDLADETISTLTLVAHPRTGTVGSLVVDATVELATDDLFGGGYTLDGRLELTVPERDR